MIGRMQWLFEFLFPLREWFWLTEYEKFVRRLDKAAMEHRRGL